MAQRLNHAKLSAPLFNKYLEFSLAFKDSSLDLKQRDLINIRVSQLNGCAFCLDMHIKEAKIHGEGELRLHHVSIWRESQLFTPRERAAFEWAETLTRLPEHGVSDDIYNRVREHFSEQEISDLTFAVTAINGWNRLSIAFTLVPGSMDVAYGLSKVVFSDAA